MNERRPMPTSDEIREIFQTHYRTPVPITQGSFDPIPGPESTPATLGDLQAVEHRMTAVERAEAEARAALDARIAKLELQVANIASFLAAIHPK